MSIWHALLVIGALLAIIVVAAGYYAYVKAQLFRLSRYEYWADKFYAASKPLVSNPETPDDVISLIESLNELITERSAPTGVYKVFQSKLEKPRVREGDARPNEKFRAFFNKHPDLMTNAEVVMHAGLLASSYASILCGSQARAVLADVFSEMQTRKFELGSVEDIRKVSAKVHRGAGLVPLMIRH